jgi:hypothetical protein
VAAAVVAEAPKVVVNFPDEKAASPTGKQQKPSTKKSGGRKGKTMPSQKAKFCMYHLQGVCRNKADACVFAHSLEEMHEARTYANKNGSETTPPMPTTAPMAVDSAGGVATDASPSTWCPPQPMFVDISELGADFGTSMNEDQSDKDVTKPEQQKAVGPPPGLELCAPPGLHTEMVSAALGAE